MTSYNALYCRHFFTSPCKVLLKHSLVLTYTVTIAELTSTVATVVAGSGVAAVTAEHNIHTAIPKQLICLEIITSFQCQFDVKHTTLVH